MPASDNNASNVTAGKPNVGGAIYVAPKGTTLPTSATGSLNSAFECLGYVSDSGLVNATDLETTEIKAWGGDTVLTIQTSKSDKFTFTLLEILKKAVLEFLYGSSNVTGTALNSGLTVAVNNDDMEEVSIVINMILRDNTAKRIVIPDCKISEIGEINYTDSEAVGYETTVTCMPDSSGNYHYEYLLKSAVSG